MASLFSISVMNAQPPCQVGFITKSMTVKYQWNGICCDVTVHYCFKVGSNTIHYEPYKIDFDPACFGLDPNAPPPFPVSSVYNFVRKKVVAQEAASAFGGPIPLCPQTALFVLDETAGQCWNWAIYQPDPLVAPVMVAEPCDANTCRRVCQVCRTQEDDPCLPGVKMLNIGPCTDYGAQRPCPNAEFGFPGACHRVICESP